MDHDRLFKELISNFFLEFLDLFFPELRKYVDDDFALMPLDKEIFTDVTQGDKHIADLVIRAKVRGKDAFFIIHVEAQAKSEPGFPQRMFVYFSRLSSTYDLPVCPIVVFTYDQPRKAAPNGHTVDFPGLSVLRFQYAVVQLNRLSWRSFVKQPNPVASAMMAKMKMTVTERPLVKLECLRLLASLKLNPAKSQLIGGFIDSYLQLTALEMKRYERELATWDPTERETTMELISSWERKGLEQGLEQGLNQGLHQGKEQLLELQLQHRFSTLPSGLTDRLDRLTTTQLDELAKAIFTFESLADLEQWLSSRETTGN